MKINKITLGHTFFGALFILLALTSCQIDKFLNRQKSNMKIAEDQKTLLTSELQAKIMDSRSIRLSDSIGHSYQVDILPVDTFSFSPGSGFKGKAFSISITGKQFEVKNLADNSNQALDIHNLEQDKIEFSRRQEHNTNLKTKEKESRITFPKIIMALLSLLILIAGWQYWRRMTTFEK